MHAETALTTQDIIVNLLIFLLSSFLGLELIRHVSRLLHTPLMSLTNAISSVSVVAALILLASPKSPFIMWLAVIAVALAMSNVMSGFMITERILLMFRSRDARSAGGSPTGEGGERG